ncbi:hypothetical protein FQA39_LY16296 [Lamprigera yunnana]|nr:hypothetical protein FQA39_LY16296 [Lamprigera yunnana]
MTSREADKKVPSNGYNFVQHRIKEITITNFNRRILDFKNKQGLGDYIDVMEPPEPSMDPDENSGDEEGAVSVTDCISIHEIYIDFIVLPKVPEEHPFHRH